MQNKACKNSNLARNAHVACGSRCRAFVASQLGFSRHTVSQMSRKSRFLTFNTLFMGLGPARSLYQAKIHRFCSLFWHFVLFIALVC